MSWLISEHDWYRDSTEFFNETINNFNKCFLGSDIGIESVSINRTFLTVGLYLNRHKKIIFQNNEVKFLICTDVAARGLDIKGMPYIINVTLPDEKSNYVHRIGRVGRAERMGLAISLVSKVPEKVLLVFNSNFLKKWNYFYLAP